MNRTVAIDIAPMGNNASVSVNGTDISDMVQAIRIEAEVGKPTRVFLELIRAHVTGTAVGELD